ncbi:MAG: type IV pilus assembly protein PilM [Actinobacteria bacterium]|nr:type IV pilus assembly protein PilM [Actinomycetota bacterium]
MSRTVVGVDIGTSAVRACEMSLGASRPVLLNYGQVGIPLGTLVDGEILDVTSVIEALLRLWSKGGFSSKEVSVGIAGLRAITREVDMPYVSNDEVDSAVRFQSEEIIPFPIDRTVLASQVLKDYTSSEGHPMRRVLVAAAHRDMVDRVIQATERAGLTPVEVDLLSSALVRTVAYGSASPTPEAIISIGAGLTVVVVHQAGRPQFVRTVGIGGNAATLAISGTLGLPFNDAEQLKRQIGQPGAQVSLARRAVEETMDQIVSEIRSSLQYFSNRPDGEPLSRVLLTGGGSLLPELPELLASKVDSPVYRLDITSHVDCSHVSIQAEAMNLIGPVLASPVGLCLPEPNPGAKRFNLLPEEIHQRRAERSLRARTLALATVVIVIMVVLGVLRVFQVRQAQDRVDALQSQVAVLNGQIPRYNSVVAVESTLAAKKAQIAPLASGAVDWLSVLRSIQAHTPAGFTVSSFSGTAAPPSSATVGTKATKTSSAAPAQALLGQISVSVQGPGLASASTWLTTFGSVPVFANVSISSVTVSGSTASFTSQLGVTSVAKSTRAASL